MKKLFRENRGFRLVFLIVIAIIVIIDLWVGITSLQEHLGWIEYTSAKTWESNILRPIHYWASTGLLIILSLASVISIPILSGMLQTEKAPIKSFLVTTFVSVLLLPVVFIWSNSLNPISIKKEFSGLKLWEAVNKKRKEKGVNELAINSWACTIATMRLNDNLRLGNGNYDTSGFEKAIEKITKPYQEVSPPPKEDPLPEYFFEYLIFASNLDEVIASWENSLGNKALFEKKDYKFGCADAQGGYGVVITAY